MKGWKENIPTKKGKNYYNKEVNKEKLQRIRNQKKKKKEKKGGSVQNENSKEFESWENNEEDLTPKRRTNH